MFRKFAKDVSASFFKNQIRQITTHIVHITDSEGSDFAFKALQRSKLFRFSSDGKLHFNKTTGITPHLINGGDTTDRGKYDLRTTKMFVDIKKREPELVTLEAGNREIKNTRFATELHSSTIHDRLLKTKSPYWLAQPTTPRDYVIADMIASKKFNATHLNDNNIENYVNSLTESQCQLIYLKWMLDKTMGSPLAFRYRREELAELTQKSVSEQDVLQSFIRENSPNGLMGEYLQLAQLGVIIPNTGVLSVHGGLTRYNIGRVPDMHPEKAPILDAKTWINDLNRWYQEQIQKWVHFKPNAIAFNQPGYTPLDQSVLPVPGKQKYVMTADMLNSERQFVALPEEVSAYLHRNHISIVLIGHQPCGDHPSIIADSGAQPLLVINGDTGYAAGPNDPTNTRGNACHTLEISVDEKQNTEVVIDATLPDNTSVKTHLRLMENKIEGDLQIGKILDDNRLVQCRLANGDYRLVEQKGFQVKYSVLSPANLAELTHPTSKIKP